MTSSQGTQPSKMNKTEATLRFNEAHRALPERWYTENRHYSIRVKKAAAYDTLTDRLVLSTIVTRTRRHTELTTKKTDKPDGKPVLCQRAFSSVFRAVFFTQLNCTV